MPFDKFEARCEQFGWKGQYTKLHEYWRRHHRRFVARVEREGFLCQDCGGGGGETVPILDDGSGPFEECGWCEGTGKVTRWLRGQWLRWKREEKRQREVNRG